MPQVFQVLRCYKCMVFQVHQVKKAIKWQCKMCGEKQSRKRNYGIGTSKDCRGHVQKLNGIKGNQEQLCNTDDEDYESPEEKKSPKLRRPLKSKWSNYVEEEKEEVVEDIPSYINDEEVVLDIPKKKPRKKFETQMKPKNKPVNSWETNGLNASACTAAYDPKMSSHDDTIDSSTAINIVTYSNNDHKMYENKSATEKTLNIPKKSIFVPPKVRTKSKWADYVEHDEQFDDDESYVKHDETYQENNCNNQTNVMNDDITDFIDFKQEQASDNGLSELIYSNIKENNDTKRVVTKSVVAKKFEEKPTSMFTLCDDTDLDNILDF